MKLPGIFGMASLFGGMVLAVPMAIIGFEMLAREQLLFGAAFLLLAVTVLFLPEYVMRQIPSPKQMLWNRIPRRGNKE